MTTPNKEKEEKVKWAIRLTGLTLSPLGYWIGATEVSDWWIVPVVVLIIVASLVAGLVVETRLYGTSIRQAWRGY